MRFERIFDDLEGRFAHHEQEQMRAVSEDLERAERAQLTLTDRLRGAGSAVILVRLERDLRLSGAVEDVGADWMSLCDPQTRSRTAVIPLGRISYVQGLATRVRPADSSVLSPRSLGSVLRGVLRDRSVVRLETTAGAVTGRLSAVGADTVDLTSLPTGEAVAVPGSDRVTVPLGSLLAVLWA